MPLSPLLAALVNAASGDFMPGHSPGAELADKHSRAAAIAADRADIGPTRVLLANLVHVLTL
jgi:hypothetical protein